MMALEEFDPARLLRRFQRLVRQSCGREALATMGSWCLMIPGMRPHAPKRNVIVGLVYVYMGSILASVAIV